MINWTKAYWFCGTDHVLRYGDGRKAELGVTHDCEGELIPCKNGLHASANILDAIKYAPGPVLFLVELGGDIAEQGDKVCARSRTYLKGGVDVSVQLRQFARACALDVAHLWDMPVILRQYLETGNESIRLGARRAAGAAYVATICAAYAAAAAAAYAAADAAAYAVDAAAAYAAHDAAAAAAAAYAAYAAYDAADARKSLRTKQEARLLELLAPVL